MSGTTISSLIFQFAKLCNKPLFVFDQAKGRWFTWGGDAWAACEPPVVTHAHITGTGTRFLEENGKKAIEELFDRSFGPASKESADRGPLGSPSQRLSPALPWGLRPLWRG